METENFLPLVYDALRRVNEIRPPDKQVPAEPDVLLVGDGGALDSLTFTTLILALESRVREKIGKEVPLMQEADFKTLMEQFRTPRMIAELINGKL